MRIIKINADERKIEVLDNITTNSEDPFLDCKTCYNLIGNGCDMVEWVYLGGGIDLILDEEGRLREQKSGFHIQKMGLDVAGNGLITLTDTDNGTWIGLKNAPQDLIDYIKAKLEQDIEWFD